MKNKVVKSIALIVLIVTVVFTCGCFDPSPANSTKVLVIENKQTVKSGDFCDYSWNTILPNEPKTCYFSMIDGVFLTRITLTLTFNNAGVEKQMANFPKQNENIAIIVRSLQGGPDKYEVVAIKDLSVEAT